MEIKSKIWDRNSSRKVIWGCAVLLFVAGSDLLHLYMHGNYCLSWLLSEVSVPCWK